MTAMTFLADRYARLLARAAPGPLDRALLAAVPRLLGDAGPGLALGLLAVRLADRAGHVCVDLHRLSGTARLLPEGDAPEVRWPDAEPWLEALRQSPAVACLDGRLAPERRPLGLDPAGRLYAFRALDAELCVARQVARRLAAPDLPVDPERLRAGLAALLGPRVAGAPLDGSRLAAVVAALRPLCLVTGGPGTGKTFTAARISALVVDLALAAGAPAPRLALAAPTGKAAARLGESFRGLASTRSGAAAGRAALAAGATTLHRLLGARPGGPWRHDADRPVAADLVVVDEGSMVDLELLAALLDAVPPEARLVLLGDADQLAPVGAGVRLTDLAGGAAAPGPSAALAASLSAALGEPVAPGSGAPAGPTPGDARVVLRERHRFGAGSAIGQLADAVAAGDADAALGLLRSGEGGALALRPAPARPAADRAFLAEVGAAYAPLRGARTREDRLAALGQYRLLGALRHGPAGCLEVAAALEAQDRAGRPGAPDGGYEGRALLVVENDPGIGLWNGDLALVVADPARPGQLVAAVAGPAGEAARLVPLGRLPACESALCTTIHKSQGSEVDAVGVLLPAWSTPLLTRELVYTAVTRARHQVTIYASEAVLREALARRDERPSGLPDRLAVLLG